MTRVVTIPGDGIGPEVVAAARRVLDASAADLRFEEAVMGQDAIDRYDTPLPAETVDAVRDAGLALKGPVTTPIGSGFRSVNVALRKRLDLYANVRPCRYLDGIPSRLTAPEDIDLVVVRENLEDLYAGIEFGPDSDAAAFREFLADHGHETAEDTSYSVKPISRTGAERIVRHGFELAEREGYDRVTAVDKANIMKATDGMFMDVAAQVAEDYDVDYEHVLVDNMAQQLVLEPERYGVVVTQNIYGDILSDLTAGLVGGIGVAPSVNRGDDAAVFATVHGTAPDIAGTGRANPTALCRSAAMLLDHIGDPDSADRVRAGIEAVLRDGPVTPDLGGDATTAEMTDAIVGAMQDA